MADHGETTASPRVGGLAFGGPRQLFPGVLIAAVIALASQFVAEHYGTPAMLLALLFGISLNSWPAIRALARASTSARASCCAWAWRFWVFGSVPRC